MFKLVLEKAEEPETKLPTSTGSSKKQETSRKTSISALLTMAKPLTLWIKINCGKFWKRWEYQTIWPDSWEICLQVRKQQLELLDMENRLVPNRKRSTSRLYIVVPPNLLQMPCFLELCQPITCACMLHHSVTSSCSWPPRLYSTRLFCPWNFPGGNTGVGCHFLLQGIFPTQGSTSVSCIGRQILLPLSYLGSLPTYHAWDKYRLAIVLGLP